MGQRTCSWRSYIKNEKSLIYGVYTRRAAPRGALFLEFLQMGCQPVFPIVQATFGGPKFHKMRTFWWFCVSDFCKFWWISKSTILGGVLTPDSGRISFQQNAFFLAFLTLLETPRYLVVMRPFIFLIFRLGGEFCLSVAVIFSFGRCLKTTIVWALFPFFWFSES